MKWIGQTNDIWGNVLYLTSFNAEEKDIQFDINLYNAILITPDDKKIINRITNKKLMKNLKYTKLYKLERLNCTTEMIIREYSHPFMDNFAKWLEHKDDMSLECIDFAKTELEDVFTFKQFGEIVANKLIKKYDLKKAVCPNKL